MRVRFRSGMIRMARLFRPALFSLVAAMGLVALSAAPAAAVPAFAQQTGQPCQSCHVGGLGPQLTPFGRDFKLHGYVMRSGPFTPPISMMAIASYVRTHKDAPTAPSGYNANNNIALDQVSLFVAGGFGQHLGAFVQTTYDGIAKAWSWDNVDIRTTMTTQIKGADVLLGASLNNNPGVQDVWNTLPAWGFPYTDSGLAPAPTSSPMLSGTLAQNTLGVTGYAWINSKYYIEAGEYGSVGERALKNLGGDPFDPGDIKGAAPYGRVAMQNPVGNGMLEVGAFGMKADIHPGRDRTLSATDTFTDLGVDAAWQTVLPNGDNLTFNARYLHEKQDLTATCTLSGAANIAACASNDLTDLRADASYYWRNKAGVTVSAFSTTGSSNADVYADNRTEKPNSSGVLLQVDHTFWGDGSSPLGSRFNMRVGAQYTAYATFDGASHNYDKLGANASDNNTFRVFSWIAF